MESPQEEVPPLIAPFVIKAPTANKQAVIAQLSQDPE
jgi:hypothetical protein